ncbi:hypothetical protein ACFQ10_18860 [Streptomyces indonesiensis]
MLRGGPRGLAAPRPLGGGAAGFLALTVGDFDGDGAADLLASAADGEGDGQGDARGVVRVLYGPFGTKAHPARTAPLPTGPTDRPRRGAPATATAGDFNGDHRTDVVLTYRYGLGQADQPEPGDTAPSTPPSPTTAVAPRAWCGTSGPRRAWPMPSARRTARASPRPGTPTTTGSTICSRPARGPSAPAATAAPGG